VHDKNSFYLHRLIFTGHSEDKIEDWNTDMSSLVLFFLLIMLMRCKSKLSSKLYPLCSYFLLIHLLNLKMMICKVHVRRCLTGSIINDQYLTWLLKYSWHNFIVSFWY
jgi:uncharacterized membrane protein YjdF